MPLLILLVGLAVAASGGSALVAQADGARDTLALIGTWQLDLARTHYGPGVDRRRREQMQCDIRGTTLTCAVESIRADGRRVNASFATPRAGGTSAVSGVPDIDSVDVRPRADGLVDATFSYQGRPTYGYRAFRSSDGQSLFIVAVDPVTRVALTSLVVYGRVGAARRAVPPNER